MNEITILENQNLDSFINSAKVILHIRQNQFQCCFTQQSGERVFFKRILLPKIDLIFEQQSSKAIGSKIQEIHQLFKKSQTKCTRYLINYEKLIISYPHACLMHAPIVSTLTSYIQSNLDYETKIQIIIDILSGALELLQNSLFADPFKQSNIVIVSNNKNMHSIAFLNVYDAQLRKTNSNQKQKRNICKKIKLQKKEQTLNQQQIKCLGLLLYKIIFQKDYNINNKTIEYAQIPAWLEKFILNLINQNLNGKYTGKDILKILKNAQLCAQSTSKYFIKAPSSSKY